jgi:hypothetical protein
VLLGQWPARQSLARCRPFGRHRFARSALPDHKAVASLDAVSLARDRALHLTRKTEGKPIVTGAQSTPHCLAAECDFRRHLRHMLISLKPLKCPIETDLLRALYESRNLIGR